MADKDLALQLIRLGIQLLQEHAPSPPSNRERPQRHIPHNGGGKRVIDFFRSNPGKVFHVSMLQKSVPGVSRDTVLSACSRGVSDGLLCRERVGWYKLLAAK